MSARGHFKKLAESGGRKGAQEYLDLHRKMGDQGTDSIQATVLSFDQDAGTVLVQMQASGEKKTVLIGSRWLGPGSKTWVYGGVAH
jgi:hypothetical protein